MFGKGLAIRERFDNIRMDYLDQTNLLDGIRWSDRLTYDGYECQLESEPRARLILSHLCSFESEPPKHRSSNDPDGRSPHSYLGHRI